MGTFPWSILTKVTLVFLFIEKSSCSLDEAGTYKVGAKNVFWTTKDVLHPELPHLPHNLVVSLCETLKKSWIPDRYRYLWTKINLNSEPESLGLKPNEVGNTTGDIRNQNQDGHLKITSSCHAYSWKRCIGTPRFPLSATCGFFDVVPLPASQCSKDGSKLKIFQRSILIDHARALELCLTATEIDQLKSSKKTATVRYLPVRVDLEPKTLKYASLYCLGWRFRPSEPNSGSSSSGAWQKEFQTENKKCRPFAKTWDLITNKTTLMSDAENQLPLKVSSSTLDLRQDEDLEDMKSKDDQNLDITQDLIYCSRGKSGDGTTCKVLPKTKGLSVKRLKRGTNATQTLRQSRFDQGGNNQKRKRHICCDSYDCGICSEWPRSQEREYYPREYPQYDDGRDYFTDEDYDITRELFLGPRAMPPVPNDWKNWRCDAACIKNFKDGAKSMKDATTAITQKNYWDLGIAIARFGSIFFPPLTYVAEGLAALKYIFGADKPGGIPPSPERAILTEVTKSLNEVSERLGALEKKLDNLLMEISERRFIEQFAEMSTRLRALSQDYQFYTDTLTPQSKAKFLRECDKLSFSYLALFIEGQISETLVEAFPMPPNPYQTDFTRLTLLRAYQKICNLTALGEISKAVTTTFAQIILYEATCEAVRYDEPTGDNLKRTLDRVKQHRMLQMEGIVKSLDKNILKDTDRATKLVPCLMPAIEEFGVRNQRLSHQTFSAGLLQRLKNEAPHKQWTVISFQTAAQMMAYQRFTDPFSPSFKFPLIQMYNRNLVIVSPDKENKWSMADLESLDTCLSNEYRGFNCMRMFCDCTQYFDSLKNCRERQRLPHNGFYACFAYLPKLMQPGDFDQRPGISSSVEFHVLFRHKTGMIPPCNIIRDRRCMDKEDIFSFVWI